MGAFPRKHIRTPSDWTVGGHSGHVWKLLRARARRRDGAEPSEPEPGVLAEPVLPPKTVDELADELAAVMARRTR